MKKKFYSSKRITSFILLILLVFVIIQLITRIINSPVDYDEGYNLQVSINLWSKLTYATFDRAFDYNITTGPAILIPAALFVSPTFPLLPRVVMVIYTLSLVFFYMKWIAKSQVEKILFLILTNLIPLFFFFSTQILGELPAFFFLLLSYYLFYKKRWLLSGIFLGLSILTKTIFIFGAIPIVIISSTMMYKQKFSEIVHNLKRLSYLIVGIIIVFLIWNLYMFISVNMDTNSYLNIISQTFMQTKNLSSFRIDLFNSRLNMIRYALHVNPYIYITGSLFISFYIIFVKNKEKLILKMLSIFYITYFTYFMFFSSTNWYRHLFPAIIALLLLLPYFLANFLKRISINRLSLIILLLIYSGIKFSTANKNDPVDNQFLMEQNLIFLDQNSLPYFKQKNLLRSQLQTAEFIKNNIPYNEKITGLGWVNAPEISILAGRKIERDPFNEGTKYIIYHIYGLFSPTGYVYGEVDKKIPKKKIYESPSYIIFQKV